MLAAALRLRESSRARARSHSLGYTCGAAQLGLTDAGGGGRVEHHVAQRRRPRLDRQVPPGDLLRPCPRWAKVWLPWPTWLLVRRTARSRWCTRWKPVARLAVRRVQPALRVRNWARAGAILAVLTERDLARGAAVGGVAAGSSSWTTGRERPRGRSAAEGRERAWPVTAASVDAIGWPGGRGGERAESERGEFTPSSGSAMEADNSAAKPAADAAAEALDSTSDSEPVVSARRCGVAPGPLEPLPPCPAAPADLVIGGVAVVLKGEVPARLANCSSTRPTASAPAQPRRRPRQALHRRAPLAEAARPLTGLAPSSPTAARSRRRASSQSIGPSAGSAPAQRRRRRPRDPAVRLARARRAPPPRAAARRGGARPAQVVGPADDLAAARPRARRPGRGARPHGRERALAQRRRTGPTSTCVRRAARVRAPVDAAQARPPRRPLRATAGRGVDGGGGRRAGGGARGGGGPQALPHAAAGALLRRSRAHSAQVRSPTAARGCTAAA